MKIGMTFTMGFFRIDFMAIESEIKLSVPDRAIFGRIASLGEIAGFRTVDNGISRHTDTYFDTGDLRLYREKIVFRLRTSDNKNILACKTQGPSREGIFRRIETEAETIIAADDILRGNLPDIPPVRALYERIGIVGLTKSLCVTNDRHTIRLDRGGSTMFELVLDDVTFCGPRGRASVLELEVESLSGSDEELTEIGGWLAGTFGLPEAGPSKYILGMQLVGGAE